MGKELRARQTAPDDFGLAHANLAKHSPPYLSTLSVASCDYWRRFPSDRAPRHRASSPFRQTSIVNRKRVAVLPFSFRPDRATPPSKLSSRPWLSPPHATKSTFTRVEASFRSCQKDVKRARRWQGVPGP